MEIQEREGRFDGARRTVETLLVIGNGTQATNRCSRFSKGRQDLTRSDLVRHAWPHSITSLYENTEYKKLLDNLGDPSCVTMASHGYPTRLRTE